MRSSNSSKEVSEPRSLSLKQHYSKNMPKKARVDGSDKSFKTNKSSGRSATKLSHSKSRMEPKMTLENQENVCAKRYSSPTVSKRSKFSSNRNNGSSNNVSIMYLLKKSRTKREIEVLVDEIIIPSLSNGLSNLKVSKNESSNIDISSKQLTQVIDYLGTRSCISSMLKVLRQASRKDCVILCGIHSFNAAILQLAKSDQKVHVISLLKEMKLFRLNPNSYTFTALFLAVDGGSEASSLWKSLTSDYSMHPNIHIYNAVIRSCSRGHGKDAQAGFFFFYNMRDAGIVPTKETYISLMNCCVKMKQKNVVLSLMDEMQRSGFPPSEGSWGAALSACAADGDITSTLSLFNKMKEMKAFINTRHYNALLTGMSKNSGQDKNALKILEEICCQPVTRPDIVTLNSVLASCAKSLNYDDARLLLERMCRGEFVAQSNLKTPKNNKHPHSQSLTILPDVISYNIVLSVCPDPISAFNLLQEMRMSRRKRVGVVTPTAVSYTNALSVCRAAKDFDMAKEFMALSKADGLKPNVFMYSAFIWASASCHQYQSAIDTLRLMKIEECLPNDITYNGVIAACVKDGKWEVIIQLFDDMMRHCISPTLMTFDMMRRSIRECDNDLKVNILEKVLCKIGPKERRPNIGFPLFYELIRSHGELGNWNRSLEVFNIISEPNAPCYSVTLYALSVGLLDDSSRWKHISVLITGLTSLGSLESKSLENAVKCCSKANHWNEALDLLNLSKNAVGSISVSTVNAVISACGRNNRACEAVEIINKMKSELNIDPNERSYRSAIMACNQAEHQNHRMVASHHVLSARTPPQREEEDFGCDDIGMAGIGREDLTLQWWECALSLLRRMTEESLLPDLQIYSSVISACGVAGKWQRAIGVLKMMEDEGRIKPNLYCINAAMSACEKGSAWIEAVALFEQMKFNGIRPNFVTINSLVIALDKSGQRELAENIYRKAVSTRILSHWKWNKAKNEDETVVRMMDLHQYSVSMAKIAVSHVIESMLTKYPAHDITQDLVIITGKGKYDIGVLGPLIISILQNDFGLKEANLDDDNKGRVIVLSKDLNEFVKLRKW